MKTVSNDFKTTIKDSAVYSDGKVDIISNPVNYVLTNLVTDGDFSNGTTGWLNTAGSISVTNQELTLVKSNVIIARVGSLANIVQGRVYYFTTSRFQIYDGLTLGSTLTTRDATLNTFKQTITNLAHNVSTLNYSILFTATVNADSIAFNLSSVCTGITFGKTIFVDLTTEFGAGNEPIKADLDAFVLAHGYFDTADYLVEQHDLFNSDKLKKIEISASSKNNNTNIGVIAPYVLNAELLGDTTQLLDLTTEKMIKPSVGIMVNGVYEYVDFQRFVVVETVYNDTTDVTKIYAVDYTYKLNKEYVDSNVYPISLFDYAKNVIEFCGLTLYNESILNGDFILTEQPIENLKTCREIVASVAQLALCFVSTNTSNELVFHNSFQNYDSLGSTYNFLSQFTYDELSLYTYDELITTFIEDSIDDISKDTYWNLKLLENSYKTMGVNTLTLKISQVEGENNSVEDEDKVLVDGSIEVAIEDNPFINTEEKRLAVINDMFDVVNGYKNVPFNIEYRGFPYLELNDLVEITLMNDSIFLPCIDEIYILYNGGLSGKLKTYAITPADTKYKNKTTLANRVKTAEIKVDKANAEITLLAEDLDSVEAKLTPEAFTISVLDVTEDQYGETISNINKNFIFNIDGLEINSSENKFSIKIDETEMGFYDSGNKMAYIGNSDFNINRGKVESQLIIGVHKIEKYSSGITVFRYIGE